MMPTWSLFSGAQPEIRAVAIADQREHAAAHRDARRAGVPCLLVRRAEQVDLLPLQLMERLARRLGQQGRAHHVQTHAPGALRSRARAGTPPDVIAQGGRLRLDREVLARTDHPRVAGGDALAVDDLEKEIELLARQDAAALRVLLIVEAEGLVATQRRLG